MGLGAEFSPPTAGGRSASQLKGPADSRARPLTSDAVTAGADRAALGSAMKRCVLSLITLADMIRSLPAPLTEPGSTGEVLYLTVGLGTEMLLDLG